MFFFICRTSGVTVIFPEISHISSYHGYILLIFQLHIRWVEGKRSLPQLLCVSWLQRACAAQPTLHFQKGWIPTKKTSSWMRSVIVHSIRLFVVVSGDSGKKPALPFHHLPLTPADLEKNFLIDKMPNSNLHIRFLIDSLLDSHFFRCSCWSQPL